MYIHTVAHRICVLQWFTEVTATYYIPCMACNFNNYLLSSHVLPSKSRVMGYFDAMKMLCE